ncbi:MULTISPECIES: hypothetical protein [unclassified Streptomyces]|uniref:hypothetical protein n=1 Tax=unclassified Streptomyces TaxID=2593676 RepID=UPI003817201B
MSVIGVWVVGVVTDDAIAEARRRFPVAARAHGIWPEPFDDQSQWYERLGPVGTFEVTPGQPSRANEIALFAHAVDEVRNSAPEVDAFQDHLLHTAPQQEGEDMFCAAVPRSDGAAALMWALGLDATLRLPGCCGQFLLDAAQVRAALPAAEQALVVQLPRRADVAARVRLWLDEMADDPNRDIDELIDGPLRVLRHAARTGSGAVGLTLCY